NLRAVQNMARVLGKREDAAFFARHAERSATALNTQLWNPQTESWQDRHPETKKPADVLAITTFYPFYAGVGGMPHLGVFRKHLFNPDRFWLPYPVPALAADQPDFNPNVFWQGPSWPAATAHVLEAAASTAKRLDRTLLPQVAELFRRAIRVHLQPRADFYERYNPLTGRPLSRFRDYMHSWWIDSIVQHVAGLTVQEDQSLIIDPLPMGLEHFELLGAPVRGKRVDVLWRDPTAPLPRNDPDRSAGKSSRRPTLQRGLLVRVNGQAVLYRTKFQPGDEPIRIDWR
ncbi:MAG: trehalase family glycosidase, partial [Phycisphaerales bacterium]|nr:trehalase family glycosidase [Phycisphaerales bacterium]